MKRVIPVFFVAGLGLAAAIAAVGPGCGSPTHEGCQTDMDCKGDRVCDFATGACVASNPVADAGPGDAGVQDAGPGDGGDLDGGDAGPPDAGPQDCRLYPDVCEPNRYSDAAQGDYPTTNYPKLLLRKTDGQLRSDNADGAIIAASGWAEDAQIHYWLMNAVDDTAGAVDAFGGRGMHLTKIYVILDENDQPVGRPVLSAAPDTADFSPLAQEFHVSTVTGYTPDGLKSADKILQAAQDKRTGVIVTGTNIVHVIMPIDKSVTLENAQDAPGYPALGTYWYAGQTVYAFNVPGGEADGTVPIDVPSADPYNKPPTPRLSEMWQFKAESGAPCASSASVYLTTMGNAAYMPLPQLHLTTVPSCTSIPRNATDVKAQIDAGTFTVTDTITVLRPQVP